MRYYKKLYNVGMYGGKFFPLHMGHKFCIDVGSVECNKLYVILFYGGDDEIRILQNRNDDSLSPLIRVDRLTQLARQYTNVYPIAIDVSNCKLSDGTEDWDAETPLVLNAIGKMDVVYSSEPKYDDYFQRAYPWAEHTVIDPPRTFYPISATMIRNMTNMEEIKKWKI